MKLRKMQQYIRSLAGIGPATLRLLCHSFAPPWTTEIPNNRVLTIIENSHYRQIFYLGKKVHSRQNCKVCLRNVVNAENIALQSSQILYILMYCVRKLPVHWAENGCNFHTQYKSIQNLQTFQASIFRILQHCNFIKHCNFTPFSMLFLAEMIYLHLLV